MLEFDDLDHERYMREALAEAEEALRAGERPIGAVVVWLGDGAIVGRGRARHLERGSKVAHAEMNALLSAERFLRQHDHQCALYTTVEPCVMCLGATVMSDVDHIVYSLPDHWIEPSTMLENAYVRRHIQHYVGGPLRAENLALWERSGHPDLPLILTGKLP